jgi:hypothetical protein
MKYILASINFVMGALNFYVGTIPPIDLVSILNFIMCTICLSTGLWILNK